MEYRGGPDKYPVESAVNDIGRVTPLIFHSSLRYNQPVTVSPSLYADIFILGIIDNIKLH